MSTRAKRRRSSRRDRLDGDRGRTRFGYDAAKDSGRRRAPQSKLISEDQELTPLERARLVSGARDVTRNYVVAAWAIRKHLDFVAHHTFQAQTGDPGFNRVLQQFITERSKAEHCDAAGRHPLRRLIRLAEARRTLDGDVGLVKLRDRRLQAIEGDRVRQPGIGDLERRDGWMHGVRCDAGGRALAYAVHQRTRGGFTFERTIPAERMLWYACWDSHLRFDAVRGVSPVAAALNNLRDLYEGSEYALAKLKIAQLFGLVIYSASTEGAGDHRVAAEETEESGPKYEVDFGKGPIKLELDEGDRAEFLDNKTPATESQNFLTMCIAAAIKALDLPFCFWDEAHTNFFGSKAALTLYLQSVREKRADVQDLLEAWTNWQLREAVRLGELTLPSGMSLEALAQLYEWVPSGLPWFDRAREVRPALQAIAGGIDTYSRLIRELYGCSFEEHLDELKRDQDLISSKGVVIGDFGKFLFAPDAPITSE